MKTYAKSISAAHPVLTGRHDLYDLAMKLVGERHAKGDLVELVNWLLSERAMLDDAIGAVIDEAITPGEMCTISKAMLGRLIDAHDRVASAKGAES